MRMPGFSAEVSLYNRGGQYEYLNTQTDRAGGRAVTPAVTGLIVNGGDFRPDSDTPAPIWQYGPFGQPEPPKPKYQCCELGCRTYVQGNCAGHYCKRWAPIGKC